MNKKKTCEEIYADHSHVFGLKVSDELLKEWGTKKFSELGFAMSEPKIRLHGRRNKTLRPIQSSYDLDNMILVLKTLKEFSYTDPEPFAQRINVKMVPNADGFWMVSMCLDGKGEELRFYLAGIKTEDKQQEQKQAAAEERGERILRTGALQ
jgi:hypothetical protein